MATTDPSLTEAELKDAVTAVINRYDANGDGEVDYNEFLKGVQPIVNLSFGLLGRSWLIPYYDRIPAKALEGQPELAIYLIIMKAVPKMDLTDIRASHMEAQIKQSYRKQYTSTTLKPESKLTHRAV